MFVYIGIIYLGQIIIIYCMPAQGVCTDGIETTPNVVYGVSTDGIVITQYGVWSQP